MLLKSSAGKRKNKAEQGKIAIARPRSTTAQVLESKMLSTPAYDDSKADPVLRFRNAGDVYRYFDFTAANCQSSLSAVSKGCRFRFAYERLAKLHVRLITPRRFSRSPHSVVKTF